MTLTQKEGEEEEEGERVTSFIKHETQRTGIHIIDGVFQELLGNVSKVSNLLTQETGPHREW